MKVRKKQSSTKISDMLTDFDDRAKGCFLKNEEFGDLSDHILSGRDVLIKEENFNAVDQLDIMDISVSNFQFATFNRMELEGLDIINENDFMEKDELFHTDLVSNGSKDLEEVNSFEGVTLTLPNNIEDSSNNTPKESSTNLDEAGEKLSKRAQKRKKQLEESKPQCPVRSTARHFTKMFEFFEANPGLATGQLPKTIYRKKWRDLTDILNQQGIGEKTTEKWRKTWSDYKLHLRKKLSGIKRSGKALDVPNQFTKQDKRALTHMGVSLCDELSMKKRFNPDSIESEDSSSHSTTVLQTVNIPTPPIQNGNVQTQPAQNGSIPVVTREANFGATGPKKPPKFKKQQRQRKLAERRRKVQTLRKFRAKTAEYQTKSLAELRSLRTILDRGLNRIGDVLERLVRNSESNASFAANLAETAAQIATTTTSFAEIITGFNNKHSNTQR